MKIIRWGENSNSRVSGSFWQEIHEPLGLKKQGKEMETCRHIAWMACTRLAVLWCRGKRTCHGCVVPVVWTACPDSRSTSCRQWRCWWDCERSASPAHSHSTPGAADTQAEDWEQCGCRRGGWGGVCVCVCTVWAEAERGVLCTGVRLLLRLSHRTICPEYVPPTTRLGWNCANAADITADWTNTHP